MLKIREGFEYDLTMEQVLVHTKPKYDRPPNNETMNTKNQDKVVNTNE